MQDFGYSGVSLRLTARILLKRILTQSNNILRLPITRRQNLIEAIEKEAILIENHQVWENYEEEPPNPLNITWVFKIKDNTPRDPLKLKSCLCRLMPPLGKCAFLQTPLTEDVFIQTPKGVNRPTAYLKLKKSLYGLKQAPKNCYETLTKWLNSIGFTESNCDPCLYICNNNTSMLSFHVNDLVLVGPGNNFEKSCHKPNTILGMKFEK
ncbi:uncharacterized protein VP01_5449g1 [Puccinia sorghi]|uniref:Reverse transcriptase Ty1/copia-type domain-containing protein n=1 Tax=Puccinia sorghi TaxID=27349 RepID=A0A0L6ULN7_9BASI|nr:uncharacterized protein VP01_5449g1 [Puccinia sorghi]